ncbi:ATP-binding cassette, subfamily B, AbcA/BmrA [Lachnospiraceae bacterium G11]|nr:ATP-binding cassette, subfamily B, AbcA/BmrA [Lachnospiraceae bacterium G11]
MKKSLKELYRGSNVPVIRTILGSLFYVAGTIVIATQADSMAELSVGNFDSIKRIFVYAFMCILGYLCMYLSIIADLGFVDLATGIRKKVWKKTMNLPYRYFDREGPNHVISRITSDPEYSYQPFKLLQMSCTLIAFLLMVFVSDAAVYELAFVLVLGFIITMVLMFVAAKYSERGATYTTAKLAELTAFLAERFNRMRFIKAMNSEEKETDEAFEYIDRKYEADKYNAMALTMAQFGQSFITFILFVAAFLFGAFMIKNGSLKSTTSLAIFYAYGGNLALIFRFFAQFPTVFAATKGGSGKLISILREHEEILDDGRNEAGVQGDISLSNISFKYEDRKVLDGVSLRIPKGKVTTIVGPNGSGKSTVLKVIDRIYGDFDGNLLMGEENSRNVPLKEWRDKFGVVGQNASMFEGSIKDNILYGATETGPEELNAVIKLVGLEGIIDKHGEGLDFNVGPNGEKLSGGEQQRIAIARAMLRNPEYLILDEATANLDTVTEKEIKNSIMALMKGRTSIVVTHSYEMAKESDNLIVMKDGRVEDQGEPGEVLMRNEFYRDFANAYNKQEGSICF